MKARFLGQASAELLEAADRYDAETPDLGDQYLRAVNAAVREIETSPSSFAPKTIKGRDVRQRRVKRFPYAVVYLLEPDEIVIVAVAHGSRHPDYWKGRVR